MAHLQLKSLRTRFLTLLALGGTLVASAGLWITYTTTVGHFEAQLVERGKLLADTLNHSAMVADTPMQVQHVVDELSLSPHIHSIVVATGEPPEVVAASDRTWSGMTLDQLPDRHLGEHISEVIARGNFGHHFDDDGKSLVVTVPLGLHISAHRGHGTPMVPSDATPGHGMMQEHGMTTEPGMTPENGASPDHGMTPDHGTTHEHGAMQTNRPSHDNEPGTTSEPQPYRGAIVLFLDNTEAATAISQILWLLCIALLAAVLITMGIAYILVDRQILARLNLIRGAMTRREASAGAAPVPVIGNDEISELGRAFNNMVDKIDAETMKREGAVKKLEDSEERFRSVVDNSPTKIHIKDVAGRFLLSNKVSQMLIGFSEDEIIGKTTYELFPNQQADEFRGHDQAVLDTGQTLEQEEQWELDDGVHTFLTVKFPIRDGDGEITAVGGIGTDITERKAAEEAVLAAMSQAESANRTKAEFLTNMSHELRTPLNAIIGFSEIIMNETLGPVGSIKYRDYADDIHESGQHLLALINDILDLSKVGSGSDELHEENIEIAGTANAVVKLVVGLARSGNIKLELDVSDGIPLLYADERKVKQILLNLLSNAIKFTPDDGKVTLKIWSRMESGTVFQVTDTGIGIALKDIPKAFAPFQQIDSGLNRKHDGTGLGLPLTKALVEMHGGYLDLQSKVGFGTTVTVRFPAQRVVTYPGQYNFMDPPAKNVG